MNELIIFLIRGIIENAYVVAVVGGIAAAVIVKIVVKSRRDKVFENNRAKILFIVFSNISLVDSYKQSIYNYWQDQKVDKKSGSIIILPLETFKEIFRYRQLLLDCIDTLTLYKDSPYLSFDEYLVVQQYAWSALSHFYVISNVENAIGINNKSLKFHRYYAKLIILRFKKSTPEKFIKDWNVEFEKAGGIKFVNRPLLEPGDIMSGHHDFRNELSHYDAKYAKMMKLLDEIKDNTDNLKKDTGE